MRSPTPQDFHKALIETLIIRGWPLGAAESLWRKLEEDVQANIRAESQPATYENGNLAGSIGGRS